MINEATGAAWTSDRDGARPEPLWSPDHDLIIDGIELAAFSLHASAGWATVASLSQVAVAVSGPGSMSSATGGSVDVSASLDRYVN